MFDAFLLQMIWHLLHERNDLTQKLAIATMPRARTKKAREGGGEKEEEGPSTFLTGDKSPEEEIDELASKVQAAVDLNVEPR